MKFVRRPQPRFDRAILAILTILTILTIFTIFTVFSELLLRFARGDYVELIETGRANRNRRRGKEIECRSKYARLSFFPRPSFFSSMVIGDSYFIRYRSL